MTIKYRFHLVRLAHKSLLVLLVLSAISMQTAIAQKLIHGTVRDADTGETLPAANIQIEGTYRGTITNNEGAFEIQVTEFPATLLVRFIGYESARVDITASSETQQDIQLQPVTYRLQEIVVTDEDPGVRIMREVIERKKVWRANLLSYETDAYNRFAISNDTGIVSIIETFTETYWDKEEGMKEVLKARRETANMDFDEEALPAAMFVTNLYDDDVEIAGYNMMGVTHPRALNHYRFVLEGTRYLDDQVVYDISVKPRNKLKSAFVGRVSVLDSAFAMIDVELKPGEAFLFPQPIDRYDVIYRQQYSNFGKDYWLPVDFRSDIDVKISLGFLLSFPTFHIEQVSRFTNYDVNIELPDTLYANDDYLTVDSVAVAADSLLDKPGIAVPLSQPERVAYASIDSTMGLEEAFAPTGTLARFVDMDEDEDNNSSNRRGIDLPDFMEVKPDLWFNRVDAFHGGLGLIFTIKNRFDIGGGGGYSSGLSGDDQWSYYGLARLELGQDEEFFLSGRYDAKTAMRYRSELYGLFLNGFATVLGREDYFDYYRSEGFKASAGYEFDSFDGVISIGYRDEKHQSLEKTTDYSLFKRSEPRRENPLIEEGNLRAVSASFAYGDDFSPVAIFGQRRAALSIEHSPGSSLNSDFEYTRYEAVVDWRFQTFNQRRLLPNVLDVRLTAGSFSGKLPFQRQFVVDGSLGAYRPFGGLRTLTGIPYTGDQQVSFMWEHNFRTVPFELMGLRSLARRSYNVILFGGHGRTWLKEQEGDLPIASIVPSRFHHEIGLGLSGLFGMFRIDIATRLDAPGFTVGFSAARLF